MKILCITQRTPRDLICFDQTFMTYAEIKLSTSINDRYDIVMVDEVEELVYVADLSKMMLQNIDILSAPDYTALEALLTEAIVVAYQIRSYIPKQRYTVESGKRKLIANTTEAIGLDIDLSLFHMEGMVTPTVVSASHDMNLAESYGHRNNPSMRNIKFLRHRLTDLIFSHTKLVERSVNFDNTIPVISGVAHYPVVFEDEMYVVNGTKALKEMPEGGIGNVLIDFSPIGDIDIVRFPDCEVADSNVYNTTLRMPEGKSFADKTPLFVIGGRFVMGSEMQMPDDRTFIFNRYSIPLDNIILSNKAIFGEKVEGTMILNDKDPDGTFENEMMESDNYLNYVILIDNPTVEFYMLKHHAKIQENMLRFPPESGGVLIKNMTREVIDYSRELESDQTIVYLTHNKALNRLTNEVSNNTHNIAYQTSNMLYFNHSINDEDDGFTLIDIVAEEQ